MLKTLTRRLFGDREMRTRRPAKSQVTRPAKRTRLGVEQLDDRTLPSASIWTGAVNSDWYNPSNWSGGRPTSSSDISIPYSSAQAIDFTTNGGLTQCNSLSIDYTWGGTITCSAMQVDYVAAIQDATINVTTGDFTVDTAAGQTTIVAGTAAFDFQGSGQALNINGASAFSGTVDINAEVNIDGVTDIEDCSFTLAEDFNVVTDALETSTLAGTVDMTWVTTGKLFSWDGNGVMSANYSITNGDAQWVGGNLSLQGITAYFKGTGQTLSIGGLVTVTVDNYYNTIQGCDLQISRPVTMRQTGLYAPTLDFECNATVSGVGELNVYAGTLVLNGGGMTAEGHTGDYGLWVKNYAHLALYNGATIDSYSNISIGTNGFLRMSYNDIYGDYSNYTNITVPNLDVYYGVVQIDTGSFTGAGNTGSFDLNVSGNMEFHNSYLYLTLNYDNDVVNTLNVGGDLEMFGLLNKLDITQQGSKHSGFWNCIFVDGDITRSNTMYDKEFTLNNTNVVDTAPATDLLTTTGGDVQWLNKN